MSEMKRLWLEKNEREFNEKELKRYEEFATEILAKIHQLQQERASLGELVESLYAQIRSMEANAEAAKGEVVALLRDIQRDSV